MKPSSLFEPLSIGNLHLKNRIALAPMTRSRAGSRRVANELMAEYYYQRATAGLLITEATVVSKQGIGWIDSPGIYTEEMVAGWRKVTDKVNPTPALTCFYSSGIAAGPRTVISMMASSRFLPRRCN